MMTYRHRSSDDDSPFSASASSGDTNGWQVDAPASSSPDSGGGDEVTRGCFRILPSSCSESFSDAGGEGGAEGGRVSQYSLSGRGMEEAT
eukprot:4992610-Pleurochrysis_carterae.AAC.1